ncbi:aldo/keto reductase [Arthrobacter alpinus]|nr:aldo/keto reductase [Arthrobacter alpinus]
MCTLSLATGPVRRGRATQAWLAAIDGSLATMGLDYIDLMLIHSPQPWGDFRGGDYAEGNREAWRALEDAYKTGKLRAIGVSDFQRQDLTSPAARPGLTESTAPSPSTAASDPGAWDRQRPAVPCAPIDHINQGSQEPHKALKVERLVCAPVGNSCALGASANSSSEGVGGGVVTTIRATSDSTSSRRALTALASNP